MCIMIIHEKVYHNYTWKVYHYHNYKLYQKYFTPQILTTLRKRSCVGLRFALQSGHKVPTLPFPARQSCGNIYSLQFFRIKTLNLGIW